MKQKFIYWQDDNLWIGYLEEFPDYWTQGETLEELKENLRDLWRDLASENIPMKKVTGSKPVRLSFSLDLLRHQFSRTFVSSHNINIKSFTFVPVGPVFIKLLTFCKA